MLCKIVRYVVDLSDYDINLSGFYIDLPDVMSIFQAYFVINCVGLTWKDHVFKNNFLTNEQVTSQH